MKEIVVPIDKTGRVVLPKNLRDELAIEPGDLFKVSVRGTEINLRPENATGGLIRKGKGLVFSARGGPVLDREIVEKVLAETREENTKRAIRTTARAKARR